MSGNHALRVACALALASTVASAQIKVTPPPTDVRVSEIRAVDALRGSFVVEWTPAVWPPTGTTLQNYVLSSLCQYEGLPSGGATRPSDTGAQIQYTGPPYRVRATCGCQQALFFITTEAPRRLDAYSGRSGPTWLQPRFQVPCTIPSPVR
jgi:hypothetical protein